MPPPRRTAGRRGRAFELSGREPRRQRRGRRRQRPEPAPRQWQGLPRRPLPRGPPFPGSRHPRHGRAVRSRHGRGEGGAVRRPGDGPGPRRLGPDPARLRRRPARSPLGRGQRSTGPKFSLNGTNCSPLAVGGTLRGGGANPLDPGRLRLTGGLDSVPAQRLRRARLPAEALHAHSSAGPSGQEPEAAGGARRPRRRRQHRRAAVTLPKAVILEQASLANVCTRVQFAAHDCPQDSIYGYATADTPLLDGPLKGPVYLRSSETRCPTWSPPCTARSTSTSTAASTAPRAVCATPSTSSPTCRSRSSCSSCAAASTACWSTRPTSAAGTAEKASTSRSGDRSLPRPERQEGQHAAEATRPVQEALHRSESHHRSNR